MAFLDSSGVTRLWQHIIAKLGNKVDKETGKGLSTNDYTTTEKNKLAGIAEGANNYTLPVASSTLGGVKTTNTDGLDVLTANGYAPIPIVDGIPYFMPVSVLENNGFPYLTVGNLDLNLPIAMSVGSNTKPVYFLDGYPYETTYTLEASVPANAKFTDTTYTAGNSGIAITAQKIYNKGILSLAQGTTNGTIKYTWFNQQVNNVVESDLKIKGLDTAAYHPESYFVPATRTINNKALSANISLTASDVGAAASSHTHSYLPLTGGTLTGSLTVNDNIYGKGTLVSQTNSYPGLTIQNTSGANLAMLYSNGTTGGYSNTVLRVYSSASAYSSFSFRNDGSLNFGGSLYSGNHTIKGDSYPSLIFANTANNKSLAYIQYQTNSGDYGDLQIAVKNSSSGIAYFTFKNSGIFVAPNDIIANGGVLKSSKNSSPSIALTNASGEWLAYLAAETTDGSYGNAKLRVNKSATEGATFTFGNNGNINVPGTVNLGSALPISSGGTGATSAASALANLGAASSTLVRGQMKTFTIAGDKDHYYPVVFNVDSGYFVNRIAITRHYNDTAPDDWGTDTTHKGGLTFQFQWNGDISWGGNGALTGLKVETLIETYCKMVGGMKLSTSGVVVWLRGGSALYKVLNEMGSAMSITPYYDTFTDDDGKSFPVRTYDASVVDSEIQQRLVFYPLTGGNLLGKLYASEEISGTQLYSKTNNYPQLTLQNNSGANLAMLYVNTTTGDYSSVYLCVYSSASSYSTFNFGNDGKLSCGSLALTTALPISSGGTGATTASGALTNLGALPLTGGTLTGNLGVNGTITAKTYLAVERNSNPQLALKNANSKPLAVLYTETSDGSYGNTHLQVYKSATESNTFTFDNTGNFRATMLQVDGSNNWPSLYFKCSSKTNPGVLLQASATHGFGIYCYGTDLDSASTRYYEGYRFPDPATGLTENKNYTVYSEKNIIYSSSQPTGVKGAIWLKPV